MPIIGDMLVGIAKVLDAVLTLLWIIIIARAVLSWVNPDPYNPIVRFVHNVTEPILHQVRKRLPLTFGGMDFSPLVVFFAIIFIQEVLVYRLAVIGASLR